MEGLDALSLASIAAAYKNGVTPSQLVTKFYPLWAGEAFCSSLALCYASEIGPQTTSTRGWCWLLSQIFSSDARS